MPEYVPTASKGSSGSRLLPRDPGGQVGSTAGPSAATVTRVTTEWQDANTAAEISDELDVLLVFYDFPAEH